MALKLVAEHIRVARAGRTILDDLDFAVAGGEALLLTGRNGAGKTTLIRAIAGLIPLAAGALRLDGGAAEATIAEQAHAVGHANGVKSALSVQENAEFWARYLGGGDAGSVGRTADAALARFGLDALADIPAAYLSAGQRRRLGLARLLLAPRPLWLLDEPTVSLDAASTAVLAEVIGEHVAAGGIVVAATHLPLGLTGARELRLGPTQVGPSSMMEAQ